MDDCPALGVDFFTASIIRCTRFVRPERANDSTFGGSALAAWHVASHAMLPRRRTFGFSLVEFLLTPGILSVLSRADLVLSPKTEVRGRVDADTSRADYGTSSSGNPQHSVRAGIHRLPRPKDGFIEAVTATIGRPDHPHDSALKSLHLAIREASKRWRSVHHWKSALQVFQILFGE